MLTKSDLSQIKNIVQTETKKIVKTETRKIVVEETRKIVAEETKKIVVSETRKIVASETKEIISKELKPIKEDILHIRRHIKTIVNYFDREYLELRKRVERIESHLNLSPIS
jgi:hypothetical protein